MNLKLFRSAAHEAHDCFSTLSHLVLWHNRALTDTQTIGMARAYLISEKLNDMISDIEAIALHCNHGLNGTVPEYWNEFDEDEEDNLTPYCPYEAIISITETLAAFKDFPMDVMNFVEQTPQIEINKALALDKVFDGLEFLKVIEDGEVKTLSRKEREKDLSDKFIEGIEDTFDLENFLPELLCIQTIAQKKGSFHDILNYIKQ